MARLFAPVAAVTALCLVIAIVTAASVHRAEERQARLVLAGVAETQIQSLRDGFRHLSAHLLAIRGLFNASERVEADEFKAFGSVFLQKHAEIESLSYVAVDTDWPKPGATLPGSVTFMIERAGAGPYEGFGTGADGVPENWHNLFLRTLLTGEPAAATTQLATPEGPGATALVVALAVYRGTSAPEAEQDRRKMLQGFVVGTFDLDRLMEARLGGAAHSETNIRLEIDRSWTDQQTLVAWGPDIGQLPAALPSPIRLPLLVADGRWTAEVTPASGFSAQPIPWLFGATLAAGIGLTILLAGYLALLIGRHQRVRELVRLRTRDLEEVNADLSKEVAERARAEHREQAWHERLVSAIEALPHGFALWDSQDRLVLWNAALEREIRGLPGALHTGLAFNDYVRLTFERVDPRIFHGDVSDWIAFRRSIFDSAAEPREVQVSKSRFMLFNEKRTGDGGTVGLYLDVSESRLAAQQVRVNEARLARAQRLAKMGSWIRSSDGTIEWSDEMYSLLGWTKGPLSDVEQYYALLHPADRARVRAAIARVSVEGAKGDLEYRVIRPDGQMIWVRSVVEARLRLDGSFDHIAGTTMDITDLKRVQHEITAAKEAAERADRTKSEFLASMSHELRTPLNAILGFSEMMKEETFGPHGDPHYLDYSHDIHASGSHLLTLINDILDLSKIEAGRFELDRSEIDPSDLVESALRLIRERADAGGLELATSIDPDLPTIVGDERRLLQVLLNLLSNAVKFTPTGGTVEVSASVESPGGIFFSVSDTGVGMAKEDIPTALSIFGQVENQLSHDLVGTGLGLPLAMSLVEIHGGRLEIDSTPGRGTRATIWLPVELRIAA